jgi:hypothetical protein
MSKSIEINLTDTVLFNIAIDIAEAISRETTKMLQLTQATYSNFLKPRQYSTGLISSATAQSHVQGKKPTTIKGTAHKIRPSDVEIAKFIEIKTQQLGYQSQGIKLLPEKTGEILEFTFEKPREKEKIFRGNGGGS